MIPAPPRAAPAPPVPITLEKLLLVEGATPMHLFEALLRHLGLSGQVEIRDFRGVGDFRTFVRDLAKTAEFQTLVRSVGVIRDAEQDTAAARQSVTDALAAAGLTPAGTPGVRTSIFILPDNANPGMIETLCMQAVKQEPNLAAAGGCVDEFFLCLQRSGVAVPTDNRFAKHQAQAFLATRPEVQLFPGVAAYRGYWPWDSPAFDPLKQFLRSL